MIDKETKEAVPVTAFLKGEQLAKDIAKVNDAARGKFLSVVGMALALMKNYDPFKSPTHFKMLDLMKKFDKTFGATGKDYGKVTGDRTMADIEKRRGGPLELPVHRGHVVPGSLQLRLPPHGALHHSVRDAGRGDQLLRLQHGRRLAEHHREDAHDGHAHQVVRRARPSRDLRRRQEGRRSTSTAHNLKLDRRSREQGQADTTSTSRASPRPRAKRSCARARRSRRTSGWPSSTARSC